MKPTRIQYFFAQDWPLKIWLTLSVLVFSVAAVRAGDLSLVTLKNWQLLLSLIWNFFIWALLGFFVGLLSGSVLLPPLYRYRAIKNGGPFKQGDIVQILVGSYRGQIARIYSSWQGDSVRVELGEQAKEGFNDVFAQTQLLRVTEAGLPLDG